MNLDLQRNTYYKYVTKRVNAVENKTLLLGIVWIFLLGLIGMFVLIPNTNSEKPYHNIGLIVNGSIINTKNIPVIDDGVPLISLDDIKKYVDENIIFDKNTNKLIITTEDKVIRIGLNKSKGVLNGKEFKINAKAVSLKNIIYVPIGEFEKIYGINVKYNDKTNAVVIDINNVLTKTATVLKNNVEIRNDFIGKTQVVTKVDKGESIEILQENEKWLKVMSNDGKQGFIKAKYVAEDNLRIANGIANKEKVNIRKLPSIKQPIYEVINKGESIDIYAKVGNWYKVRTEGGTVGYITEDDLTNITAIKITVDKLTKDVPWKPLKGKINLVWEQVENFTPKMDNVDKVSGLDVVSPTWFEVTNANGNIKSKVDSQYIRWARANGYKIWAMVGNGVSSDKTKMTSEFLNNSNARENAINKVLYYTQLFGLDGINIDFEYIDVKDKDIFTQFMRELVPLCREKGLVISVDVNVKVESPTSLCYDRKKLAQLADYVIVMTYDQYWSTSPVSGSVAQYEWVDNNIASLLEEIPKEKFIMGIPFYTRQWKEVYGKQPSSAALAMANANNIIRQNDAKVIWDEESGQYYAEFVKANVKYKIWLEEARSINLKSSLALKYDLAGAASWRRGYETQDIWSVLNKNLKEIKNYDEWEKNNANKSY